MKLFFTPPTETMLKQGRIGLGDMCATVYTLENWGRLENIDHEVCGSEIFKELLSLIKPKHVKWTDDRRNSIKIADHMKSFSDHWIAVYDKILSAHNFDPSVCQPLKCDLEPYPVEEYTMIQLDGRSSKARGHSISSYNMKKLAAKYCKGHIAILGGVETEDYWPEPVRYFRGNLEYIIRCLLGCKAFFGCDSGLSHLAGMLGVPCKIFILVPEVDIIKHFYRIYPTMQCYSNTITML